MTTQARIVSALKISTLLLLLVSMGCAKRSAPAVTPAAPKPATWTPPPPARSSAAADTSVAAPNAFGDIFFDYDKAIIRPDQVEALNRVGAQLADEADVKVLLEGYCDERGTVEYNLALGEMRAKAVKEYLVKYGVELSRLSTISYGEERPFAEGHDEEAWSQNRRVICVKQ